jgi:acetyl-CoA carboxylase, biotin carboxylase subunit
LKIARKAGYYNAGTLEFLADQQGNFYFLEMNTRLQVEHPVTELVTGIDLVHWQLRIAAGERLTIKQQDISWRGSAIECRVYAEDPDNNFFPSPGTIAQYAEPGGPGIRIDGGVYPGWTVPIDYDPLLAKLVVWAETRERAAGRMRRAVSEYHISGIKTNLGMFSEILADASFLGGCLHTGFLDEMRRTPDNSPNQIMLPSAILAAAEHQRQRPKSAAVDSAEPMSAWRIAGRQGLQR